MTQFLKKLSGWLAKLAFWRKSPVAVVLASEAEANPETEPPPRAALTETEPTPVTPMAEPGVLARMKNLFTFRRRAVEAVAETEVEAEPDSVVAKAPRQKARASASDAPETPQLKPSIFARVKQSLSFRRKPIEAEAETEDVLEKSPPKKSRLTNEPEAQEISEPQPSFSARLKRWFSFRRQPTAADIEGDESDKTLVIDKAKVRSEATTATEDEGEAPPPSWLKRLTLRLSNKWVWIPAMSLAAVGIISWVLVLMLHVTHEKEQLKTELKAAKKMLEKKSVATLAPPVPPPLSVPASVVPAKPEKKIDPAFQIIGHVPVPEAEEALNIAASDCVVKDKKSVAENLKNCITGFNQAIASVPGKTKKP